MERKDYPLSFRVNDADLAIIDYLKTRLGLGKSQVIKLALRRLMQWEKRREK
jgi:hypothetical protein